MRRNGTVYAAVNCRGTSHRLTRNTVKSSTTITGHRPVAFQLGHVLTPCMEEQTRIDHEIHEIFPLFSSFSSPFLFLSSLTILHLLHSPLFSLSLFKFSFPPSPPILLPLSPSIPLLLSPSICPRSLWPFSRLRLAFARRSLAPVFANYGETARESWRETGRLSRVLPSPEGGPRAFRRRLRNRGVSLRKLCDVLLEDCETVGRPPLSALSFRRVVTIQRREGEGAKGEDGRRICIRGSPITGSITPGRQVCRVLMFRWPPPSPQRFNIHAPVTP